MSNDFVQIFFVKAPIPGKVKSRLARFSGAKVAAQIYAYLLENTIHSFQSARLNLEIWAASAHKSDLLKNLLNTRQKIRIQSSGHLGERMADAILKTAHRHPHKHILLAGTDIPDYTPSLALGAIQKLQKSDIVIGPALDGGYYLIGVHKKIAQNRALLLKMFSLSQWSHQHVLQEQIKKIQSLSLSSSLIKKLSDLDTIEDLGKISKKHKKAILKYLPNIKVVMPVLNEADNLTDIIRALQHKALFSEIICADNGSSDDSVAMAQSLGASVTHCKRRGYGATCLVALEYIAKTGGCDIVMFMDADGSDDHNDIFNVLAPVVQDSYDLSLGARIPALAQKGALKPHQVFGNKLSVFLIKWLFGYKFQDLGPLRAIRYQSLLETAMDDQNFGWTIQMQIRSLKCNHRITEIPVHYKSRVSGKSKVTATIMGSLLAGIIIISTVFRERFFPKK